MPLSSWIELPWQYYRYIKLQWCLFFIPLLSLSHTQMLIWILYFLMPSELVSLLKTLKELYKSYRTWTDVLFCRCLYTMGLPAYAGRCLLCSSVTVVLFDHHGYKENNFFTWTGEGFHKLQPLGTKSQPYGMADQCITLSSLRSSAWQFKHVTYSFNETLYRNHATMLYVTDNVL
jgi:hypothetical protein